MNDFEQLQIKFQRSSANATWLTAFLTFVMAAATVVTTVCAVMSVNYLFTQTPLFEGTRPQISYFTSTWNTTGTGDGDTYKSQTTVTLHNLSRFPAKDVRIYYGPLIEGGDVEVDTSLPYKVENASNKNGKLYTFEVLPSGQTAHVLLKEEVKEFPEGIDWGAFTGDGVDDLDKELGNKCLVYSGRVFQVYSEFGEALKIDAKCEDKPNYVKNDFRSEEGKKRNAELREKLIKEGKLKPKKNLEDAF